MSATGLERGREPPDRPPAGEGFTDEAPRGPEEPAGPLPPAPEGAADDLVFADVASAEDATAPAPASEAPRPSAGAWWEKGAPASSEAGALGRVALPARAASPGPAVATEPCPHCQKAFPAELGRCPFCARPRVKREASPLDGAGTSAGSPVSLLTPAERPERPDYVPESLARELEAKEGALASERAMAREASAAKRRWVQRWAPAALSAAWFLVWYLALGPGLAMAVVFAVDLVGSWAVARWSVSRGGGAVPTVLAASLWTSVKLLAGAAKLGIAFFVLAAFPALLGLGAAAVVGISIELEADELRGH